MYRYALASILLVALPTAPLAQRLVGYDPAGLVHEFTAPEGGACDGPSDPATAFPTLIAWCDPLPGPALPTHGDIGVDTLNDTYWVTDGFRLAEYDPVTTLPITSFAVPPFGTFGPVLGLGVDSLNGLLWVTDGAVCNSYALPPSGSGCFTPPLGLPLTTFASSIGLPATTDVEWDPYRSELWFCDVVGRTFSRNTAGALVAPPAGITGCPPMPTLEGIAFDRKGGPAGVIYATDGLGSVGHNRQGAGAPAQVGSRVYAPTACFASPPLHGLSAAVRPVHYGEPSWCIALSTPAIGTTGQSVLGSTKFGYTLSGANVGALAVLMYSFAPMCAPFELEPLIGCPLDLWISPFDAWGFLPMPSADDNGESSLPIQFTTGVGVWPPICVYTQIATVTFGVIELTDALETVIALP